jgi:hypothetical protein
MTAVGRKVAGMGWFFTMRTSCRMKVLFSPDFSLSGISHKVPPRQGRGQKQYGAKIRVAFYLSFYSILILPQVVKIRFLLREKGLGVVKVGTVDDFQGQVGLLIFSFPPRSFKLLDYMIT